MTENSSCMLENVIEDSFCRQLLVEVAIGLLPKALYKSGKTSGHLRLHKNIDNHVAQELASTIAPDSYSCLEYHLEM